MNSSAHLPEKCRIYLCGPITNCYEQSIVDFRKEQVRLQDLGYEVVNPHDLFTPEEQNSFRWLQFITRCISAMTDCKIVATLENWHLSEGAKIEVDLARRDDKLILISKLITE